MLLGFKKQFAPKIENGSKIHTFRRRRKVTPKIGELMHMYVGLRTKFTKRILGKHHYTGEQIVRLVVWRNAQSFVFKIHIGNKRRWSITEMKQMVQNDGFETFEAFCEYWLEGKNKVAFSGVCYHWTDFKY